jgi:hypothetical protein
LRQFKQEKEKEGSLKALPLTVSSRILGTGACGRVFQGSPLLITSHPTGIIKEKGNDVVVAVKRAKDRATTELLEREAKLVMNICHPNVIRTFGLQQNPLSIVFGTDWFFFLTPSRNGDDLSL